MCFQFFDCGVCEYQGIMFQDVVDVGVYGWEYVYVDDVVGGVGEVFVYLFFVDDENFFVLVCFGELIGENFGFGVFDVQCVDYDQILFCF